MSYEEIAKVARIEALAAALSWLSDLSVVKINAALGIYLMIPKDDSAVIISALLEIARRRGWPDGWWEDPSIVLGVEEGSAGG
jgi:hypothetical protein